MLPTYSTNPAETQADLLVWAQTDLPDCWETEEEETAHHCSRLVTLTHCSAQQLKKIKFHLPAITFAHNGCQSLLPMMSSKPKYTGEVLI